MRNVVSENPPSTGNDLAGMRVNYTSPHDLDESWLDDGWEQLILRWIDDALAGGVAEPNAMVLATVDADGRPSTRTVLCKGISRAGVVFYTNYGSDKARQLGLNPYASATFSWPLIGRQITVRGRVERVEREVTDGYWRGRPRGSQLGAWASDQSQPVASRAVLEQQLAAVAERFPDEIPTPPNWGGFVIAPTSVEFWQGRESRLHNRIRVTFAADGSPSAVERLSP